MQYLDRNMVIVGPDRRPTKEFVALYNRMVDANGGQGTKTTADRIADGSQAVTVNDARVGDLDAALTALNANVSQAQSTATEVAGGGGSTLSGSADPAFATGTTSKQVTITATGGTSPYTYAVSQVSGSAAITVDNTAVNNPTFSTASPTEVTATWKVVITDDVSDSFTVTFPVTLTGSYGGESGIEP
jgi:predicted lipoprotein with Yx(FWY)xxD motif